MRSTIHKTLGMIGSLMLACVFVLADDPPRQQGDAPQAKKADDPKKEKKEAKKEGKKAEAPSGYEDAPEAGRRAPAQDAAVIQVDEFFEAVEELGFAEALAMRVDPQVANLEAQYLPRIAPLMMAELSFINRACDLTLEQRKKIKAASANCLKVAVRQYAMTQNAMRHRRVAGQQRVVDPNALLHLALAKVLEETLLPEQRTVYDREMDEREAFCKRTAIDNLTAIIDERLVLSLDQRQVLAESLEKNWQPDWAQLAELLMNNRQYLPSIPDQFVVPSLNESQKEVWRTVQKLSSASGGIGVVQDGGAVDDFPLDEEVADVDQSSTN